MTDTKVYISAGGARFHTSWDCPGYQQGIRNAEDRGFTLHGFERVTIAEARRRDKTACRRCGGSR